MMNPIKVITSAFSVLSTGKALEHAEAWKNTQAILALLTAVACFASATGHPLPITNDELGSIAIGTSGIVSAYLTYATSKKVGLSSSKTPPPPTPKVALPPLNPKTRSDLPDLS